MKKAQAQTISFILAVITGALIIIFGYRMIFSVTDDVDSLKAQEFVSKVSSDIKTAAMTYGSFSTIFYDFPRRYSEICFYAPSATNSNINCSSLTDYPLIKDSVDDHAKSNVFLVGKLPQNLFIQYVDTGLCKLRCFKPVKGKLSLVLQGKTNSTLIS
jgi:hypothetical protein